MIRRQLIRHLVDSCVEDRGGYWIAECVEFTGGEMVHGYAGGHSRTLEKMEVLSNADYIVF